MIGGNGNRDLVRISLFAALIAVLGLLPRIDIPLAAGVPITAQTLGVMLAGLVLGPRNGGLCVLLFLFVVAFGMPFLAGGRGGLAVFFGPTAGFLAGWVPGAVVAGAIGAAASNIGDRPLLRILINWTGAFLGGVVVVYACGIPWLAWTSDLKIGSAAIASLAFLPGDMLKSILAAILAVQISRMNVSGAGS